MTKWYFYVDECKGLERYGWEKRTTFNGSSYWVCQRSVIDGDCRIYPNQPSSKDLKAIIDLANDGRIECVSTEHGQGSVLMRVTDEERKEILRIRKSKEAQTDE